MGFSWGQQERLRDTSLCGGTVFICKSGLTRHLQGLRNNQGGGDTCALMGTTGGWGWAWPLPSLPFPGTLIALG